MRRNELSTSTALDCVKHTQTINSDDTDKKQIDEWSGLANLLANLLEKYASDLNFDEMPIPSINICNGENNNASEENLESHIENMLVT